MKKRCDGFVTAGLLTTSAGLTLGWHAPGLKLFLIGLGAGLELYGVYRTARENRK